MDLACYNYMLIHLYVHATVAVKEEAVILEEYLEGQERRKGGRYYVLIF